jgi:hypothetical protein
MTQQYWNVVVDIDGARNPSVVVDKPRDWIESRVLAPRTAGQAFAIDGRTIDWSAVQRIRITVSDRPVQEREAQLRAFDRESTVTVLGGSSYRTRAALVGEDVTDDLITGAPGSSSSTRGGPDAGSVDPRRVMVVHGRDEPARRAMFDFLRAIGLNPGEWKRLVNETGKAAPYIGEVLDQAFRNAAAVVVLLTPDDDARLRDDLHKKGEPEHETTLTRQARPNVLFEAGMAFGSHPDRTVLVELGTLRPFSDVVGRHSVRLNGTESPLRDLAGRLKAAGCAVDLDGDDWVDPERFPER